MRKEESRRERERERERESEGSPPLTYQFLFLMLSACGDLMYSSTICFHLRLKSAVVFRYHLGSRESIIFGKRLRSKIHATFYRHICTSRGSSLIPSSVNSEYDLQVRFDLQSQPRKKLWTFLILARSGSSSGPPPPPPSPSETSGVDDASMEPTK